MQLLPQSIAFYGKELTSDPKTYCVLALALFALFLAGRQIYLSICNPKRDCKPHNDLRKGPIEEYAENADYPDYEDWYDTTYHK